MRTLPNMTIINPADDTEAKAAVRAACEHKGPVYLRFGRLGVPVIFGDDYKFEIGKGVLLAEGTDVTLVATGLLVEMAIKAKELLANEGISAEVINIATIKPIDEEIIVKSARKTGAVVTCEEHNIIGGLGSAVAEVLCENCPTPMQRIGTRDVFGRSGKPAELFEVYGLTPAAIAEAAKKAIKNK